jgi:hypothetical protein
LREGRELGAHPGEVQRGGGRRLFSDRHGSHSNTQAKFLTTEETEDTGQRPFLALLMVLVFFVVL